MRLASSAAALVLTALAMTACSPTADLGTPTPTLTTPTSQSPQATPEPTETTDTAGATPVDSGSRTGAKGEPVLNTQGTPTGYVVAAGDTAGDICQRFDVYWWQLSDEDGVFLGTYPILQIGQTIYFATERPQKGDFSGTPACQG